MLGNLYKRKVKIKMQTAEGILKKIDTTIWSVGEEFVEPDAKLLFKGDAESASGGR